MVRRIIHIDEEKCTGCGICANACHEGAIDMIDGKAKLVREHFCDGFGDCLPACPAGAITFQEREAPAYDEAAVKAAQENRQENPHQCPGAQIRRMNTEKPAPVFELPDAAAGFAKPVSALQNWPVQIKLAPIQAPYFRGAELLIAADCTAYAYAAFHRDFIQGKIALIGCPKLDSVDYSKKLTEIFANNDIQSVTVVRMEVPCCGGLEMAVKKALLSSEKQIPCQVVTIAIDGRILS